MEKLDQLDKELFMKRLSKLYMNPAMLLPLLMGKQHNMFLALRLATWMLSLLLALVLLLV